MPPFASRPLILVVLLAALVGQGMVEEAAARQPNIVLFLVDDLGWRDPGYMGNEFHETPHIDRMAAEGMVFSDAYSNGPNCAPSRASLMSGQHTTRHGIYTVKPGRSNASDRKLVRLSQDRALAEGIVTLAETLKAAGYRTATIGKWHLGPDPQKHGFDLNVAGNDSGFPVSYFSPYDNPDLPDGETGEYLTDRITNEAVRFIEQNRLKPFFLLISHYAVHLPIQSKREQKNRFEEKLRRGARGDAGYAGMLASVDESLGRIIATLDETGLAGDTLVVFTSDNGGMVAVTTLHPYRSGKGSLYEGGVRVPMIIKWPGKIRPGRSAVPVIGMDLYPTLVDFSGADRPAQTLDGVSLAPLLTRQGGLEREALFWHFPGYVNAGPKAGIPFLQRPAGVIRAGNWKLIEFFEDGRTALYDLSSDPGETRDLSGMDTERRDELLASLREWREQTGARLPTERNPDYDGSRSR